MWDGCATVGLYHATDGNCQECSHMGLLWGAVGPSSRPSPHNPSHLCRGLELEQAAQVDLLAELRVEDGELAEQLAVVALRRGLQLGDQLRVVQMLLGIGAAAVMVVAWKVWGRCRGEGEVDEVLLCARAPVVVADAWKVQGRGGEREGGIVQAFLGSEELAA